MALELAKYQTLIAMLFCHYPATSCLRYDRLFRQAASQDASLRWDTVKEDIYVWCLTRQSPPPLQGLPLPDRRPLQQQSFRWRQPFTPCRNTSVIPRGANGHLRNTAVLS